MGYTNNLASWSTQRYLLEADESGESERVHNGCFTRYGANGRRLTAICQQICLRRFLKRTKIIKEAFMRHECFKYTLEKILPVSPVYYRETYWARIMLRFNLSGYEHQAVWLLTDRIEDIVSWRGRQTSIIWYQNFSILHRSCTCLFTLQRTYIFYSFSYF